MITKNKFHGLQEKIKNNPLVNALKDNAVLQKCAQSNAVVKLMAYKKLKPPKIPFFVYAFCAGIIIIVAALLAFNGSINSKLNATDQENVSAITNQEQAALNTIIANTLASLNSITKTLVILSNDSEAQIKFLQNVRKSLNFDSILITDILGNGTLSTRQKIDLSGNKIFVKAMGGDIASTDIHASAFTGNNVISVGVPLRKNDRIIGAILVEFGTKMMTELLVENTEKKESAFILDSNGFNVATSSDVYNSLNFLKKATFANGESFEQFIHNSQKKRWGGTSVTLNGENRIIEFRPLAINSWTLYLVSHNILANPVRNISDEVQNITASMLLIFLLFGAYIVFIKRKTIRKVERIAFYDELTGLPNAVKFKQHVEEVIKKSPNMKYVMQKIDIENFKAINEIYDYETGNKVLQSIASALLQLNDDSFLCARIANDEFLMFSAHSFLADNSTRNTFEMNFKNLLGELNSYEFTFRYGRYFIQKGERDVADMINKTTLAHSMVKSLGHKNTWDYDDAYRQEVRRSTELINLSKSALEHNEFIVYLQPKYNLKEKKVSSGEALVRWVMEDGSLLLPDNFIPTFEQNGFVTEIDFYVLATVCARIKVWIDKGHKVLPISVNFSRLHFQNPNFVNDISAICDKFGDIRHFIEVELTETAVTENADNLSKLLDDLHAAGFTVAIDDFGAGYSSLGMLKDFKVDVLKLDQSFFDDDKQSNRSNIVVNGISEIAHKLGMKIVAEGIEITEHLKPLEKNHLEFAQGFFFAHPMPMEEFEQKYLD